MNWKPENEVANLELSTKMRDLGFPQEGIWRWVTEWVNKNETKSTLKLVENTYSNSLACWISAPTVAQMLNVLTYDYGCAILICSTTLEREKTNVADYLARKVITEIQKSKV